MKEIWKRVTERYSVSTKGRVYCHIGNCLKAVKVNGNNYITHCENGITVPEHKLVAMAFIPNPFGKLYVNHINAVRSDNRVENLEWCTSSENNIHAWNSGATTRVKPKGNVTVKCRYCDNDVVMPKVRFDKSKTNIFYCNRLCKNLYFHKEKFIKSNT